MHTPAQTLRSEDGFTVIEMAVVMVIMVILAGIVIFSGQGLRKNATTKATVAAAQKLEGAINAYSDDHGGAVPALGTQTWPNANKAWGPISRFPNGLDDKRYYLDSPVQAIADGEMLLQTTSGGSDIHTGVIQYTRSGSVGWSLRVYVDGSFICYVGNIQYGGVGLCQ